jgi:integrase
MKGSIRHRGESWSFQHEVTRNGKRAFVTGTRRTKKAAEAALVESLALYDKGDQIEPSKMTVAVFLRDWLELVKPRLKAGTFRSYHDIVEHRLIPHLGDVRLSELRPALIARCYAQLRTNGRRDGRGGLSETSIEHTHRALHAALEAAVRGRRLARNPADDLEEKPTRGHVEMCTWSADQLGAFLDSTRDHRLHELFVTAATTAMRRGELLGLRWDDVDLETARLAVRRSRTSVGYEIVEATPKSRKGVRTVDLDNETIAALRRWRMRQLRERIAWAGTWTESGYVFTREDGTGLHPHQVADAFDAAVRRSGQPVIRFHDLRHTWATLALRAGVNPKIVSERLGHAKVGFTLDVYAHATPGWQAEAAATVAGLIFGEALG